MTESPEGEGGLLNVTCPYRLGERLFGTLKSNLAVSKHSDCWYMSTDISLQGSQKNSGITPTVRLNVATCSSY